MTALLAWGAKVSADFRARVVAIATGGGFDPSWLMACIAFETGRTFSPSVRNPASSATGLIQFMDATARALGTTTAELATMSAEAQLNFVAAYFAQPAFRGRLRTLSDVYMAILWPAAVGQPEDAVIFAAGGRAFLANRGLDVDGSGDVTKAEAAAHIARLLAEGFHPDNASPLPGPALDAAAATTKGTTMPFPLLLPIASLLINAFSPLLQQKLGKELDRHADTPGLGEQIAGTLLDKAKELTGKADPLEAVAVARQDPAMVAQLEETATEFFAAIAPLLDKIVEVRRGEVAIDTGAADAASQRNDSAQVRRHFASMVWRALAVGGILLAAIAVAQVVYSPAHTPDGQIVGALILAFGSLVSAIGLMGNFGYGSSGSSGAKDVLIGEMARRQTTTGR